MIGYQPVFKSDLGLLTATRQPPALYIGEPGYDSGSRIGMMHRIYAVSTDCKASVFLIGS